MPAPTFPNNWDFDDENCCSNVITQCVQIFGDVLAQENFDPILQQDNVSEIILG